MYAIKYWKKNFKWEKTVNNNNQEEPDFWPQKLVFLAMVCPTNHQKGSVSDPRKSSKKSGDHISLNLKKSLTSLLDKGIILYLEGIYIPSR